jgi:hypothetical protein
VDGDTNDASAGEGGEIVVLVLWRGMGELESEVMAKEEDVPAEKRSKG